MDYSTDKADNSTDLLAGHNVSDIAVQDVLYVGNSSSLFSAACNSVMNPTQDKFTAV